MWRRIVCKKECLTINGHPVCGLSVLRSCSASLRTQLHSNADPSIATLISWEFWWNFHHRTSSETHFDSWSKSAVLSHFDDIVAANSQGSKNAEVTDKTSGVPYAIDRPSRSTRPLRRRDVNRRLHDGPNFNVTSAVAVLDEQHIAVDAYNSLATDCILVMIGRT